MPRFIRVGFGLRDIRVSEFVGVYYKIDVRRIIHSVGCNNVFSGFFCQLLVIKLDF